MTTERTHRRYREAKARLFARAKATGAACHLCGKPIDWDAHYNDDMAPSADHADAVATSGPNGMFGRLLISHRLCNSRRGSKTIEEYLAGQVEEVRPTLIW